MNLIIETERLFLRELKLSDTNELFKILGDKESMKFFASSLACLRLDIAFFLGF